MQITSSLTAKTHDIQIKYDAEAQAALLKAWRLVEATLRDPVVDQVLKEEGYVLDSRMEAGCMLLQDLATAKKRQRVLTDLDLNAAAELVMFIANYLADFGDPVSTLPEVVLLLSKVTPYVLPRLPLPPAAEVFDRSKAGSSVWKSYELVRQKRKTTQPSLTLMQMYELWLALQNHRCNSQLDTLEKCLDFATRLFRACMQSLAAADLLSDKVRAERDGRQA